MEASEGGGKKRKHSEPKAKKDSSAGTPKTPRSSTPTLDLVGIEEMLKRSAATGSPSIYEKKMLHAQTKLSVASTIKELYESLRIEKELGLDTEQTLAAIKKQKEQLASFD
jgi:hypothetical protein